ncbi:MAG: hypothetical protein V9G11_00065 [Bifidobacterium adolescentis]
MIIASTGILAIVAQTPAGAAGDMVAVDGVRNCRFDGGASWRRPR